MSFNVRARGGTALSSLLSIAFLAGCLTSDPAAAQSLSGAYVYQSPDGPVSLMLQEQGSALIGSMTGVDGGVFQLEGTIEFGRATGLIRIGEGTGWFAVGPSGGGLILVVAELDAAGQPDLTQAWNLEFMPTGMAAGAVPGGNGAGVPSGVPHPGAPEPSQPGVGQPGMIPGYGQQPQPGHAEPGVERDPALVGAWSYSDTYMSDGFSAITRLFMQVNPDGTYLYGDGDLSVSGAYMGRAGGGNVTRGQWRTQGGVVYVMEEGSPQWVPYARYYVEGARLMFTFANGKRQVWSRR